MTSPLVEIAASRGDGIPSIQDLLLHARDHAGALRIATAYWDANAVPNAIAVGRALDRPTRLVLWTEGAQKQAWRAARDAHEDANVELRFVSSPEGGGIFHVKLAGIEQQDGAWDCALVGSANFTAAALEKNVELGVVVREPSALATLQRWFDHQFALATPAAEFDWEEAIERAPERSRHAGERDRPPLATPAPAGPRHPATSARLT